VTEPVAPSPQEKRSSSPTRTQDFQAKVEPPESPTKIEKSSYPLHVSSQKSPSSLPAQMKLNSGSPVKKISGATDTTTQPKRELSTAFEFKSGTVVIEPPKIGPPKRMPLPKRPSAATIERTLTAVSDNSGGSRQTSPAVGLSISPMAANMFPASSASPVTTPSSIPVTRTPTPEIQELPALLSPPKTYGGFRALTWKDFRKDLNNFTPRTYYAKDLPHALQDHINSMSEYTQMMEGMRDLFKATILENTVEDEPDAPPIEIWNNVDTQSTPPWEFYYTNNMWLGEGVPPPDIKSLVSCNCKGGCNPKSKTCACLMRQREAACDPLLEFAYDKNGKLKVLCYPIFECNDLCGCSDECRNRVSLFLTFSSYFFFLS
jgi:Pre-SET motif